MHPLFQCTCYGYPSKLMLASLRKSLSCSKEWYMSCGQPSEGPESSTHKTAIHPTWYVYFWSTKTSPRISWNFLNGHHPSAASVRKSKRAIVSHISSSGEKNNKRKNIPISVSFESLNPPLPLTASLTLSKRRLCDDELGERGRWSCTCSSSPAPTPSWSLTKRKTKSTKSTSDHRCFTSHL